MAPRKLHARCQRDRETHGIQVVSRGRHDDARRVNSNCHRHRASGYSAIETTIALHGAPASRVAGAAPAAAAQRAGASAAIGWPVALGSGTPSQRAIVGAMSTMSTVPSATCGTPGPNAISDAAIAGSLGGQP